MTERGIRLLAADGGWHEPPRLKPLVMRLVDLKNRAAVVVLCGLLMGACAHPWRELEDRYATQSRPPPGSRTGGKVVLGATGYKGAFSFSGVVTQGLENDGVYLAVSAPFSLRYRPVKIPTGAVAACSRTQWSPGWDTNLWLSEARVDVSLPDSDGSVLAWCKAQGKEIVAREVVWQRLYPNNSWGTR